MIKKIYFIENSIQFNSLDLNTTKIAGSEKTLINISNELGKNNQFNIKVFNNTPIENKIGNVEWCYLKNFFNHPTPDAIVAMSDANLLSKTNCKKKFIWSHSVQTVEKFFRKNQFFPFLIHKPVVIVEGQYHYKTRSLFTSFYGKKILKLAPDYEFIDTKIDKNFLPNKNAIFITRPDRNLNLLIQAWKEIKRKTKDSNLYINPPFNISEDDKKLSIKIREKSDKKKLIEDLLNSRVMLNPGHKGEVFCLAAEEAKELCLPIVTMGYGSLYERVEHGITGFIAKNFKEFINYSTEILNNKKTYFELRNNLINLRGARTYKDVAMDLIKILDLND